MGKLKEQLLHDQMLNPQHYNNPDPTPEEMEIPEPSDAELAEIEQQLDTISFEDLNWE